MPKTYTVKLEVPSGSRAASMYNWLNRMLNPHRIKVTELTDGEVTLWVDECRGLVTREADKAQG